MEKQTIAYSEKQSAIIHSAEKLFSQTGFDGTSVRDIAQEAGVNVAMISYYFGSKDKLMEAVFEQKTTQMRLKIENLLLNNQITHLEKVNILIDDYVDKFIDQQEFHKIMMREQILEQNTPVAALILELKKRNLQSIKKLIQDGQKKRGIQKAHRYHADDVDTGRYCKPGRDIETFLLRNEPPWRPYRAGISKIHQEEIKRPFEEPF